MKWGLNTGITIYYKPNFPRIKERGDWSHCYSLFTQSKWYYFVVFQESRNEQHINYTVEYKSHLSFNLPLVSYAAYLWLDKNGCVEDYPLKNQEMTFTSEFCRSPLLCNTEKISFKKTLNQLLWKFILDVCDRLRVVERGRRRRREGGGGGGGAIFLFSNSVGFML